MELLMQKIRNRMKLIIEKNRKILKKYQSLVRTAITLDALMDSENDENYQIQK